MALWLPLVLTIGIRIQCPFALGLREPFSASSLIPLSIGMISLILLRALPGEDGRSPEIKMLAKRCTLFRRVIFCLVFSPFIQITVQYERLGLTTAVLIHVMVFG